MLFYKIGYRKVPTVLFMSPGKQMNQSGTNTLYFFWNKEKWYKFTFKLFK